MFSSSPEPKPAEKPAEYPIRAYAAFAGEKDQVKEWSYTPHALGSDDVDIRVVACGVCVSLLMCMRLGYSLLLSLASHPFINALILFYAFLTLIKKAL